MGTALSFVQQLLGNAYSDPCAPARSSRRFECAPISAGSSAHALTSAISPSLFFRGGLWRRLSSVLRILLSGAPPRKWGARPSCWRVAARTARWGR